MTIRTPRLLLRALAVADVEDYLALYADANVTEFLEEVDRPEALRRLAAYERAWETRGCGMFALLERGELVGAAGFDYWPRWHETELGWVVRRDAWGRGLATEAARACAEWGFGAVDLPYVTSMIRPANRRSIAVARRLGMRVLRQERLLDHAVVVYGLSGQELAVETPTT